MNWLFCALVWLYVVKGVKGFIEDEFGVSIASIAEANVSDEGTLSLSLGFTFNFYDGAFDDVVIGSNGFVVFTQTNNSMCCGGDPLGQGYGEEYMIAPTWADLSADSAICGSSCGTVRAGVINAGKAFAVVFDRIPFHSSSQDIVSWELVLYDTGVFTIDYRDVEWDYAALTMSSGWQGGKFDGLPLCHGFDCSGFIQDGEFRVTVNPGSYNDPVLTGGRTIDNNDQCRVRAAEIRPKLVVDLKSEAQFFGVEIPVTSLNGDMWAQLNLGGNFTLFDENTYETVWLHENGLLLFGDVSSVDPSTLGASASMPTPSGYTIIAPFWTNLDASCGGSISAGQVATDTYSITFQNVHTDGCGSGTATVQISFTSWGSITVDFIDLASFDFPSGGNVFSGFASSSNITTFCSYNGGGGGGGDDCSLLDPSQAKFIYTPDLVTTQVVVELLTPVQKADESTIDGLETIELVGFVNSEPNVFKKLSSLSEDESYIGVDDLGVSHIQLPAASRDLQKDMPSNRRLSDGSGFSGYLWMELRNFEWDVPLIAGSDVDVYISNYNTSGIFNIEICEWNSNSWHPFIDEDTLVAIVGNGVSLPDVGDDQENTPNTNGNYPTGQKDGIITVTLPLDLPFSPNYRFKVYDVDWPQDSKSEWCCFTAEPPGSWIRIQQNMDPAWIGVAQFYQGSKVNLNYNFRYQGDEERDKYDLSVERSWKIDLYRNGKRVALFDDQLQYLNGNNSGDTEAGCFTSQYGVSFRLSQFQVPGTGYTLRLSDCDGTISDETKPFTVVELDCDSGQKDFCVSWPPPGYSILSTDSWYLSSLTVMMSQNFVSNNYDFNDNDGQIQIQVDLYKLDGTFVATIQEPTEHTCCFSNECFRDGCDDLSSYWVNLGTFPPGLSTGEYYFELSVPRAPKGSLLSDRSAVFTAYGYTCDSFFLCIKYPATIEGQNNGQDFIWHAGNNINLEFGKTPDANDFSIYLYDEDNLIYTICDPCTTDENGNAPGGSDTGVIITNYQSASAWVNVALPAGLPASTKYRFKVVDRDSQEFDFSDNFEVIGYDCDSIHLCVTSPAYASDVDKDDRYNYRWAHGDNTYLNWQHFPGSTSFNIYLIDESHNIVHTICEPCSATLSDDDLHMDVTVEYDWGQLQMAYQWATLNYQFPYNLDLEYGEYKFQIVDTETSDYDRSIGFKLSPFAYCYSSEMDINLPFTLQATPVDDLLSDYSLGYSNTLGSTSAEKLDFSYIQFSNGGTLMLHDEQYSSVAYLYGLDNIDFNDCAGKVKYGFVDAGESFIIHYSDVHIRSRDQYALSPKPVTLELLLRNTGEFFVNFIEGDMEFFSQEFYWTVFSPHVESGVNGGATKLLGACGAGNECEIELGNNTLVLNPYGILEIEETLVKEEASDEPRTVFDLSYGDPPTWSLPFEFPFYGKTYYQVSMYLNGIIAFDQLCNPLCNDPPSHSDGDASNLWDNGLGGDWDDNLSPSVAVFWTNMIDETCCSSNDYCIRSGGVVEGSFVLYMKNLPLYNINTSSCDYNNLFTYEVILHDNGELDVAISLPQGFNSSETLDPDTHNLAMGFKGDNKDFQSICFQDSCLPGTGLGGELGYMASVGLEEYGFVSDNIEADESIWEGWNNLSMREDVGGVNAILECANLTLPFTFPFYNDFFDEAWVCAGGMISFVNPNETDLPSDGIEFGIADGGGLPIIAPFWAGLNPYPYSADVKYKEDTDVFHIAFSQVPPGDFDIGSFVSWQLSLSSCGDFSIKILNTDFQMEVFEDPETQGDTIPINMTIGWQETGGQNGINICHGGVECGCLEWPLVVSATGGKCSYDPEVLSVAAGSYSGAAGGDTITLTTINLESESEEWLRLRFTATTGALKRVNVTLDTEQSEFEKGILVFNTPPWEGEEVLGARMELLYNISNEDVMYLSTGSTWDFFGVWYNITIGDYSNEDIPYVLSDGSERAVFYGSGFSTRGVYYLRLTSEDTAITPAEQTASTCDVESDIKMTCRLPNWGATRGPETGVTLAIIQDKNGEINPMETIFDGSQYTVRPTIGSYSISKAGAAGGQSVSVFGQGFSTEEGVYSCAFSTLSSPAVAIDNIELQCLTPTWGDVFWAGSITIEIAATSQIALPASIPSAAGRSFTFTEEWSSLTQYSGTAKGEERIAVVGYGFKQETDESYYCVVYSTNGDYFMITDAAKYIGPKLITCDTKTWQHTATELANFTVVTSENTVIPVYEAANATRTENYLVYAVKEEVVEASAAGGSAWGGGNMVVGVHGLDPTEYYYVKFIEASTGEYVWTEKTLPAECGDELSESILYCVPVVVPRWVHNVQAGASADIHVIHVTDASEELLNGYVKFTYNGYNADLYTIRTSLSLSGVPDCDSFNFHKELRDSIAATIGYSSGTVGLQFPSCTSSTRRRRLAEMEVQVTVQVKDEADVTAFEEVVENAEFADDLINALSSKGLTVSGVAVTASNLSLDKANLDCSCGHELKESAEDNTFSCSVCSKGFFSVDGKECIQCWSGMSCEDPEMCIPDPLPGYWRKNVTSPDVNGVGYHACLWEDACLGLDCELSYDQSSALCGSCSSGYYRLGTGCVVCPSDQDGTKFGLAILMLSMIVLMWLLLLFYVRGIFKRESLEFMDQNIVKAKKRWRKLRGDGALRQVVRFGASQPKGLRASRRGSKALLGSREILIELPGGSHQLINSDPGMQVIVIKSDRGYQPIQIPLGMKMVTLPDGRQHLYNERTPIPAGAVVSPRARIRRKMSVFDGPTPSVAAKNIYTAAEAVHGMSLILPNTAGRGDGGAGLSGTVDAAQSTQMNSTDGSSEVIVGATKQFGEEAGNVIEGHQEDANKVGSVISEGLEHVEQSAETGIHKVQEVVQNMPEYAERGISASRDVAKEGAEFTTEGIEVAGEFLKEGLVAAGDALNNGVEFVVQGAKEGAELTTEGVEVAGELLKEGLGAAGDALNNGVEFATEGAKVVGEFAKDGAVAADEFSQNALGEISSKAGEIASKGANVASDLFGERLEAAGEYIEKGFQESKDAIGEGIEFVSEGMGLDGELIEKGISVSADAAKAGVEFLSNGMDSVSKFGKSGLEAVKDGASSGLDVAQQGMGTIGEHAQNGMDAVGDIAANGRDLAVDGFNEVKEGGKGILKAFGFRSSSFDGSQYENIGGEAPNNIFDDSSDDAGLEDALEVGDNFEETREELEIKIDNLKENVSNKFEEGKELVSNVASDAGDKLASIAGTVVGNVKSKLKLDIESGVVGKGISNLQSASFGSLGSLDIETPKWGIELMADLSETFTSLSSKAKIIIGFLQIFSTLDLTLNVNWPATFTRFANMFSIIEINMANLPGLSLACVRRVSMYETFLAAVVTPIIVSGLLYLTYVTANLRLRCMNLPNEDTRRIALRQKLGKGFFWLLILVYPSVSRTILQMLYCKQLDEGDSYLLADLSINCNTREYEFYLSMACLFFFIYVVGIPLFILYTLRRYRNNDAWRPCISFVFANYEERFWWYEVYDLIRRLILVGMILFIVPDSATQVAIGLMLAVFSLCVHLFTQPYTRNDDDFLQTGCLSAIVITYYCGLMIKSGISETDGYDDTIFGGFLIVLNGLLILVIIPATLLIQLRILKKVIITMHAKARAASRERSSRKKLKKTAKEASRIEKKLAVRAAKKAKGKISPTAYSPSSQSPPPSPTYLLDRTMCLSP